MWDRDISNSNSMDNLLGRFNMRKVNSPQGRMGSTSIHKQFSEMIVDRSRKLRVRSIERNERVCRGGSKVAWLRAVLMFDGRKILSVSGGLRGKGTRGLKARRKWIRTGRMKMAFQATIKLMKGFVE